MGHRALMTFSTIAIAMTTSLAGVAATNASTTDSSESISSLGLKWGINHDGWNVEIKNNTNTVLVYSGGKGIYTEPELISVAPGTKVTVLGKASWISGPANMRVSYDTSDLNLGWHRFVEIESFFGLYGPETTVRCGVYVDAWPGGYTKTNTKEDIGCNFSSAPDKTSGEHASDTPIAINFRPLEDGNWKK
jgi:hypothetical protein